MFLRFYPQALLVLLAAQGFCQAQSQTTAPEPRLMAYDSFFRRVMFIEDRARGLVEQGKNATGTRSAIGRDFNLTEPEQALVIACASDWSAKFEAIQQQAKPLLAAGQTSSSSLEVQGLLAARLKMTSDHIDQLQTALGPERFAALDALVTQPPQAAPTSTLSAAQRNQIAAYNSFFSRVWWLEDRANALSRQGTVGPLTRNAAAREFRLTAAELALLAPIVADWQAKASEIDNQGRKLSDGGKISRSPELSSLEATRQGVIADHIDQLKAALGTVRFAALDTIVSKRNFPGGGGRNTSVLTVLDVDGKSSQVSYAGMEYEILRTHRPTHQVALIVYTPDGMEEFGWETISKVDLSGGKATISLRTGETVAGTDLPPRSSLDGQADGGRTVIDFSRIKTITPSR